MRGVYLIHFQPAYKHARHYLGWASDIAGAPWARLTQHRRGAAARLTAVAVAAGSELILARTWPRATRRDERRLKNWKNSPTLCPICQTLAEEHQP